MEENRLKIVNFSAKIKKFDISPIFRCLCCTRLGARPWEENVADLSAINLKNRQKIGDLLAIFLDNFWPSDFFPGFDPTVQISSAFFEESNGYFCDPTVDFKSEA